MAASSREREETTKTVPRALARAGVLALVLALAPAGDAAGSRLENYVTQVVPEGGASMPKNGVVFVQVGYFEDPSVYVPRDEGGSLWSYQVVHQVIVARPPEPGPGTLSYLLTTKEGWPDETRTVVVEATEDTAPPEAPAAPSVDLIALDGGNTRLAVDVERPVGGVMAVVERGEAVVGAWLPPAADPERPRTSAAFSYLLEGEGPQCVTVRWVDAAGLSSERSPAGCAEPGGCACVRPEPGRGPTAILWAFALLWLAARRQQSPHPARGLKGPRALLG